jgi:hypothetical protein
MKVYIGKTHLLITGKAWEVRQKLKEYSCHYTYIQEWLTAHHSSHSTITREK